MKIVVSIDLKFDELYQYLLWTNVQATQFWLVNEVQKINRCILIIEMSVVSLMVAQLSLLLLFEVYQYFII